MENNHEARIAVLEVKVTHHESKFEEVNRHFLLHQDKEKPVFKVYFEPSDNNSESLSIRELWLSYASTPENVDFIYLIKEDDLEAKSPLLGFNHQIIDSNFKGIIDITNPLERKASIEEIPIMGWDKQIVEKELAE